jgi:AraC-like DNA-binding protein
MNAELVAVTAPPAVPSTGTLTGLPVRDQRAETVVRAIVRRRRGGSGISLSDETAVALVIDGLGQASRCAGVSERTLRRHIVRNGSSIAAFVTQVRLQAARELYALGWNTDRSAVALGYANPAAFRRFLRRSSGEGVWILRKAAGGLQSPPRRRHPSFRPIQIQA